MGFADVLLIHLLMWIFHCSLLGLGLYSQGSLPASFSILLCPVHICISIVIVQGACLWCPSPAWALINYCTWPLLACSLPCACANALPFCTPSLGM